MASDQSLHKCSPFVWFMNQPPAHVPPRSPHLAAGNTRLCRMQLPRVWAELTHHDRVVHASHLEHVHCDLRAVGHLIAACMVGRREVEVGAVGLPGDMGTADTQLPCATTSQQPAVPMNILPFSSSPSMLCFYFPMAQQAVLRQTVAWQVKQAEVGSFPSTQLLGHICHLRVS